LRDDNGRGKPEADRQTVLVSDPDAQMRQPGDKGLYFFNTNSVYDRRLESRSRMRREFHVRLCVHRVSSNRNIYANGEPWELLNGGATIYYAARISLTNRAFLTEDGPIPPRTLGLILGLDGGLREDFDLTNHGAKPVRFQLEIALRSDFAEIFEVKSTRIVAGAPSGSRVAFALGDIFTAPAVLDFRYHERGKLSNINGAPSYVSSSLRPTRGCSGRY
jgi:hypothetical protein